MGNNKTEVVIDGKIYEISGAESENYMQRIAVYLNDRIKKIKSEMKGFNKLDEEIQTMMIMINLCDDLFAIEEEKLKMKKSLDREEKEAYSAKHELINTQMKLEAALKNLENREKMLEKLQSIKEGGDTYNAQKKENN